MKLQKYLMIIFLACLTIACSNDQKTAESPSTEATQQTAEAENKENMENQADKPQITMKQVAELAVDDTHKYIKDNADKGGTDWQLVDEAFLKAQKAFSEGDYKQAQVLAVQARKLAEQSLSKIPQKDTDQ